VRPVAKRSARANFTDTEAQTDLVGSTYVDKNSEVDEKKLDDNGQSVWTQRVARLLLKSSDDANNTI
jgi:hypothetical protein